MKKFLSISSTKQDMIPVMRLLSVFGHHVYLRYCGNEAMVTLGHIRFDSIIVMEKLNDMTGMEFISRIKCPEYRKKITFLTNNPTFHE